MSEILLGFEVGTGSPIHMHLTHTVVAAMTQFGKTTTLEAIIHRSGLRAVAFKTKRGEAGFHNYAEITPYFKAGSGWQYVESLVNVALGEKVKYEPGMRGGIMRVSRGGFKDLRELLGRAEKLTEESKREFQRDLYMKLTEYLKLVVPELERHSFADQIELSAGVNIMDLSDMRRETQSLVIASVLDYAATKLDHIIIVIPEAWEHIPQGRMTPVKLVAAQFIRKGAAIGNYLLLDSQDIAGVDKEPLRSCDNWILGRQKDKREVDRTLEEIFKNRPSGEEIMTLPRGVFYACLGDEVFKVYVQPSWLDGETAKGVALGKIKVEDVKRPELMEEDELYRLKYEEQVEASKRMERAFKEAQEKIVALNAEIGDEMVWKQRYEYLSRESSQQIEALKAEIKEATEKYDEIYERVQSIEKAAKELDELSETLESVKAELNSAQERLKSYTGLDQAIRSLVESNIELLLPKHLPKLTESPQRANVELRTSKLTVEVTPSETVISVDAEKDWEGKVLQAMLELGDAAKKGVAPSAITAKLTEKGWPRDVRDLAVNVLMGMVSKGLLVKAGTSKNPVYRLPSEVSYRMKEEKRI
jgi:hypothetical protein